jgi:hypothetical protein
MGMTYDLYGISKIIERGYAHRLELAETAITKLDPNLEPISITEKYAFVANHQSAQLFRFDYSVVEETVQFSNPVTFNIDASTARIENQSKKIVKNIVESLSEDDSDSVDFFKAQWLANERQKYQLQNKLNLSVGIKSEKAKASREYVSEAINTTRGARSVMKKGLKKSLFSKLVSEGSITVTPSSQTFQVEPESKQRLIYQRILDTRTSAKGLTESPVFTEYTRGLYEGDAEERTEAVEFIAENYQEIFTLSLSEQSEIFYNTLQRNGNNPILSKVVEGILDIGKYAASQKHLSENINKIASLVEANGDFHYRMQIIEDTINTRTFTNNDISVIRTVLEKALEKPSELLSPEFIVELRKAYNRITEMEDAGNYDDRLVASVVHLLSNFYPQTMQIGEAEYDDFFQAKLDKYGVDSPDELEDDRKDDFFKEIEKEWTADDEKSKKPKKARGKTDVDAEQDENAGSNIYGDEDGDDEDKLEESCKNCGSPVCLCKGLKESDEEPEELELDGDEEEDKAKKSKKKSKKEEPEFADEEDAFADAEELKTK